MKRAVATIALAALTLVVVARWQPGRPVQLLTGAPDPLSVNGQVQGCFLDSAEGLLSIDAKAGTAITDDSARRVNFGNAVTAPVEWRPGFTGRQVGSEVEIFDPSGNMVASTGHRYLIEGGYTDGTFFACGSVTPE